MSAYRFSVPGRLVLIPDGPGHADAGEVRGSFATPVPACKHEDETEREAKRVVEAARKKAWREANRDRLREYERNRQRRYLANPEKREAQRARTRQHWADHKDEINAVRRARAAGQAA